MSQIRKAHIYLFLILQIFFNVVTFTNSAVIRREQRSITSNATVLVTSNKEVNPATVTTQVDVVSLLDETSVKGDTRTEKKVQDTTNTEPGEVREEEETTLTGLRLDTNTVVLSFDSESTLSSKDRAKDVDNSPKIRNEEASTMKSVDESTNPAFIETTTIAPIFENEKTTSKEEEVSTVLFEPSTTLAFELVDNTKTPISTENELVATKKGDVEKNYSTGEYRVETEKSLGGSEFLGETTDVGRHNMTTETNSEMNAKEEHTKNSNEIFLSQKITSQKQENTINNTIISDIDEVTKTSSVHVKNELTDTSTKLFDSDISTTFATNEPNDTATNKTSAKSESDLLIEDRNASYQELIDGSNSQSEETTILPTTAEAFNERPNKTILSDAKSGINITRISTPSSTEKRGKFIAHNYSSLNELRLPNTSDVWALAGLRTAGKSKSSELQNSVETSEEKPVNNSMVTKSLLDWTRVMATTHEMESETTLKIKEITDEKTTEKPPPSPKDTTERRLNQENEVELPTINVQTEASNVVVGLSETLSELQTKHHMESATEKEEQEDETTLEFNTTVDSLPKDGDSIISTIVNKQDETTLELNTTDDSLLKNADSIIPTTIDSPRAFKNHDKLIEENKIDGDSFEEQTTSILPTITTIINPIPDAVTMKSETTKLHVNGEIAQEANAGMTSLLNLSPSDFTTSKPFLTSSAGIIKTTTTTKTNTTLLMTDVVTTTLPAIFNMDDEIYEAPTIVPTKIQTSSPEAVTVESSTTTTTTTTIPAVTIMAVTTETQTTKAPYTSTIISNDTMMIQKSKINYKEYDVVNKTTEKNADNSSTEALEATTRVALLIWSTNAAEISTTEVDRLNDYDLDVTTASNFENNNAYDIESTTPVISTVTLAPHSDPTTTAANGVQTATEDLDRIDPIHKISDTAETSIESNVIEPLQGGETSMAATTSTTTESTQNNMRMPSTERGGVDYIYSTTKTTTPTSNSIYDESATTMQSISTKKADVYSIVPTIDNGGFHVPKLVLDDTTTLMPLGELGVGSGVGGGSGLQPMDSPDAQETDVNVIIAISVSTVGIIALILLVAFLYVMRKRQKQMSYGQRCRPVSLDAYSLDNVSVYNSVRRKGATLRASKRSYGNVAFDDPSLRHNMLGTHELARYVEKKSSIWEEFKELPQIIARADEVPAGCEEKNRYANVIPLPETRVILQQQHGDDKSEYINANYVRGPKDTINYYIACQAPLETTVADFWRMIWEQNSRVIIMATDLIENGIDKCSEYLPPSVTLDNHTVFGDYQVTLKHQEVKEKYAISTLLLKNTVNDESREITHYWYQWPENGVPTDEAAIIAMLLEARSSLKAYAIEQGDNNIETTMVEVNNISAKIEVNGNIASEKQKPSTKDHGPLTIHCSPGTGRTGTILGCDIAMRCLEEPKRTVDIPQIVYSVRRGRASAVQTKEQYEFIYKVTHMYATKISNINNDN